MSGLARLSRFKPDSFTTSLVVTVGLATFLPIGGRYAAWFDHATTIAIALLFFFHGARLSREAVIAGMTHWRLHLAVFASTFLFFPLLGLAFQGVVGRIMPEPLALGVLYLTLLPSTVQSSIAFTSIAGGNVPAAVCSASASNLIGVFMVPLLVALLMHVDGSGGASLESVWTIVSQILIPFIAGQVARRWIGGWIKRHARLVSTMDRGSILMVVYGAFSEAVLHGLWQQLPPEGLAAMVAVDVVLLAVVLVSTTYAARFLGFKREDEITIVFCGSKKSLASGVPIANVLFAGPSLGMIVLPLMLFHQIQLMACASLARRYAAKAAAARPPELPPPA